MGLLVGSGRGVGVTAMGALLATVGGAVAFVVGGLEAGGLVAGAFVAGALVAGGLGAGALVAFGLDPKKLPIIIMEAVLQLVSLLWLLYMK